MYFAYKKVKYFVDISTKEYKENPKPVVIQDQQIVVALSNWLGNSPQRVEVFPSYSEVTLVAIPCTFVMPGHTLTPPKMWDSLIQEIHKTRTVTFTTMISFSREALAHTDKAFRQELVGKALLDGKHWGKIEVYKYKIIGVQMPDQLIVTFSVGLRKRV